MIIGDKRKNIEQNEESNKAHAYYSFSEYVTKERMLTFWHQLSEVFRLNPAQVLEIGIGPKVVAGAIREHGIMLTTADINENLAPDHIVAMQELESKFADNSFDLILCARVMHHIPFSDFDHCMQQLYKVTREYVVLTLPVDDLRAYASFRITSRRSKTISIALPLSLKRLILRLFPAYKDSEYLRLWKINSSPETSLAKIKAIMSANFTIEKCYAIAEDRSHYLFVLRKNRG